MSPFRKFACGAIVVGLAALLAPEIAMTADVAISALPAATQPLGGTEVTPIVQGGTTKKTVVSAIKIPITAGSPPTPTATNDQYWDSTTSPPTLRVWDATSWVAQGKLDATAHVWTPANALVPSNNLSDIVSVSTARGNLGTDNASNLLSGTVDNARLPGTISSKVLSSNAIDDSNTVEIKTDSFTLEDSTDPTKNVLFDLSAIGAGATRTFMFPNASATFLGADTTQTITNKTISGALNSLSAIPNAALSNSSVTLSGHSLALGGTIALANTDISGLGTASIYNVGTGAGQICLTDANCTLSGTKTFTTPIIVQLNTDGGTVPSILGGSGAQVVGADGVNIRLQLNAFNNGVSGDKSQINLMTARGTMLSPTALNSGDVYGSVSSYGYDGGAYQHCGDINVIADENWSASGPFKSGTRIEFATCIDGSQASIVRGKIGGAGGGLVWGSPTGDDKGLGTINVATGYYVNGTALTSKQMMLGGGLATQAGNSTAYYPCVGFLSTGGVASETDVSVPVPYATTFKLLQAVASATPGLGQTFAITLDKNESATTVTCTVTALSSTCQDITHNGAFAANDRCSLKIVSSATAAAAKFKLSMEADTAL